MTPRLSWEMLTLNLRNPFRVAYGVSDTRQAFWLRLVHDEGWGEGTIPPYYRVDPGAMTGFWQQTAERTEPFPDDPADIEAWVGKNGPAPSRCAVDLALHDRIARRQGVPLYRLLGLPQPMPMPTSFTISIDAPAEMARMAREIPDYGVIKIKLGSDAEDEARLAAIRAARPDARLRVDANAGWSREEAIRFVKAFEAYDLEMIEQPLAKEDIEGMGLVQAQTRIPIVADESVQSLEDVEKLGKAGVRGLNLKLMKLGGLSTAIQALKRGRELGMQIMLGCMIETSLGTTAMAHLAGLADWVDLDAPILISNDPFDGVQFDQHAVITVPDRPGIGALRRE